MRSEVEVDTVRFDLCMEKMADELVLPVKRCANFQQAWWITRQFVELAYTSFSLVCNICVFSSCIRKSNDISIINEQGGPVLMLSFEMASATASNMQNPGNSRAETWERSSVWWTSCIVMLGLWWGGIPQNKKDSFPGLVRFGNIKTFPVEIDRDAERTESLGNRSEIYSPCICLTTWSAEMLVLNWIASSRSILRHCARTRFSLTVC